MSGENGVAFNCSPFFVHKEITLSKNEKHTDMASVENLGSNHHEWAGSLNQMFEKAQFH